MGYTIAQFTFGLQVAGQERVVVDLAKEFNKRGHISLVCTTLYGGGLVQELKDSGVPFNCLSLRISYDPRAIIPIIQYLRHYKVDVVITHGNSGCLIPRIAAIATNVPVFIHVEHTISYNKKKYHVLINQALSLFTDRIVCVSESSRQSLLRREKVSARKAMVIRNGLSTDRFSTLRIKPSSNNGTKIIGVIGRLSEEKGHIYLLKAINNIIKSNNNIEVIFVGDGPLRKKYEEDCNKSGMASYCHFLGHRSDVGNLLQTFDIFVLPSLYEGLPISLLEAQYFGVASIATEVGGIPEVVKNGYNGILVPPKDPDALASAILKVLNDDPLRNYLSSNSKSNFDANFTVERMATSYLKLIENIIYNKNSNSNEMIAPR